MPTLTANGETLSYRMAGSGPTLLMIHSLGTNAYLWERQIAHWRDRYTCIAFDARGHGASSNKGGVSMKNIAADLHAALSDLGLFPAHVIGISMGGLIAARLHAIDPANVLSIVYADSFPSLGEAGAARVKDLEATLASTPMDAYARDYAANTLQPATAPDDHEKLIAAISSVTAENYLQTARSVFTEDVSQCLKAISVPLVTVVGDRDLRTPIEKSREVAALVGGAEVLEIEGAGHLSNIDNPDGFHAAVDPFLGPR